ncbi:type II toxin-antitoxin system ParD family antitoxin [Salipiger abyssi]|uniref:type II toxin-antitoxin system ParD family antitoxin n=1 Tax=Salipiger abyssi TaxID=1250539 RepID=UPI001A8F43E3|nr:type II toxin-antitoxin system ParD family antitoxin [Salipiger abyssi]MBN9887203.1 type II toxin-antitoxin system ParD family antitoxin [Salipiger abyssi]
MSTRNVVLTEEQDAFVQALVATGRFQNASEALRAGLRLLEQEESQTLDLRARLREGLRQADHGLRAEGSGAEAIRAAFAEARARRGE